MRPFLLLIFVCSLATLRSVSSCTSQGGGGTDGTPGGGSGISGLLGDGVALAPVGAGDAKAGPAASPQDLSCDLSGPCCWKNAQPPVDQLEFAKASGSVDPAKLSSRFGGASTPPSGSYFIVAPDSATSASDSAKLVSCQIPCGQDIQATASTWKTDGVVVNACLSPNDDGSGSTNCQPLQGASGGPATAFFPGPQQNTHLVLSAEDFVSSGGSAALIDNINVQYSPCAAATTAPTAAPFDPAACKKVACDFNADLCGYTPTGSSPTATWQQAGPDRYKNPATGVAKSPDGSKYMAAYLKPGESSTATVPTTIFSNGDKVLKFQDYKATEGIRLAVCCDKVEGCTYDTGNSVQKGDFRQWFEGGASCPAGTQQVIFLAQNNGNNEGGVGIDNIQVFNSAQDTTPLC